IAASGAAKQALFNWALDVGRKSTPYRLKKKRMPAFLELQHRLAEKLVYAQVKQRFGGRLRYIVSAGAPLSKEIAEFFFAMDVLILEGYGMTELSAPSHINLPDAVKLGSVGRALPGVQERIAPDGEILVKAPSVFVGYWKRPTDTMEALEEGWMHTGDIGHVDEDGFLHITDRKKDLIITSGGKNIAPQNIENKLKAQPFISQAMVIGDRRKYLVALVTIDREALGQKRAAGGGAPLPDDISTDPEARRLAESAVNAVNADLASYETLKFWRLLDRDFTIDDGELTPTMKLKRKAITARFADLIERMYPEGDA
ncbi:MAG: AMP-binding protein, partial [Deltaproteobacteria bacterium]|nr:AMP-binding protein [Deltaproteobacteria bacterium]